MDGVVCKIKVSYFLDFRNVYQQIFVKQTFEQGFVRANLSRRKMTKQIMIDW